MGNKFLYILAIAISFVSFFLLKSNLDNKISKYDFNNEESLFTKELNVAEITERESESLEEANVKGFDFTCSLIYRSSNLCEYSFFIPQNLNLEEYDFWLSYDYMGFEDEYSISRSINDQISYGGLIGKTSRDWNKYKSKLNPLDLNLGQNIIKFSVPESFGKEFQISNVQVIIERKINQSRGVFVEQPSTHYFSNRYGFVRGFVYGKDAHNAKIYVGAKKETNLDGNFQSLILKPEESDEIWDAEILVVFSDGEEISSVVNFTKPKDVDCFIDDFNYNQRVTKSFKKNDVIDISLSNSSLHGEEFSLSSNTTLSITTLRKIDLAVLSSGMINLTSGAEGYRYLPHGTNFEKNVEIRLGYDSERLPTGYVAEDIYTYFYDENQRSWIALERVEVDTINNCIVSLTNHFTDFINGIIQVPESPELNAYTPTSIKELKVADPLASFSLISPPQANNNGSASFSYPIPIPSGRKGMQPNIAIQYNSSGGNGWMGLGFDLSLPAINVETRWGVPLYSHNLETESYSVSGEQMLPLVYRSNYEPRSTGDKEFFPRVEGAFNKTIRHGNAPDNYWWEVIDKSGTISYYGKRHDADEVDSSAVLTDNQGNIAHWALTETLDLNGNNVKYFYVIEEHSGVANTDLGKQIYIDKIHYTGDGNELGKYRIEFKRDGTGNCQREDVIISANYGFKQVTADLLRYIDVYFENELIKRHFFVYSKGVFGKSLLTCIGEATDVVAINCNNKNCKDLHDLDSSLIVTHRFDYFNEIQNGNLFYENINVYTGLNDFYNNSDLLDPSALGGTYSYNGSVNGAMTAGFGVGPFKNLSAGFDLGGSFGSSKGTLSMIDIDGDGLSDIVYKQGPHLKYLKHKIDTNGQHIFVTGGNIIGVSDFLVSASTSTSAGLQASFGLNLSGQGSTSTSTTNTFLADYNGDGLVDIISNGKVYLNRSNGNNGNILFSEMTSDTIYFTTGVCEDQYILAEGSVNDSVLQISADVMREGKYNFEPQKKDLDAVVVWKAPYTGTITINAPIRLLQDSSLSRQYSSTVDGVKYYIQHDEITILSGNISADDYSVKNIETNINVTKNDKIFFRVNSNYDRTFDEVSWDKNIKYTSFINSELTDANGKKVYEFNYEDDFILQGQKEMYMPFTGTVKINGDCYIPNLSDSVKVLIQKVSDSGTSTITIYNETVTPNSSQTLSINTNFQVSENEQIKILVTSSSNVKWEDIIFRPTVKMYDFEVETEDGLEEQNDTILLEPSVYYSTFPRVVKEPASYSLNGNIRISPVITFDSPQNGKIDFCVKKGNEIVARRNLTILNGLIANPVQNIFVQTSSSDFLYFEYYTENELLANAVMSAEAFCFFNQIDVSLNASLYTTDTAYQHFGNMYRGWGQFAYNNTNGIDQTMSVSDLNLDYFQNIDSTQYNSVTSIDSAYDAIDNSPPTITQSKFIPLIANLKDSSYSALNSYVKVDKNLTSLSQKIELPTNTNDTITFSEEDFITEALIVNPNYPTKVVNKTTKSSTISGSFGIGVLPVSLSGSVSKTTSYSYSDYMDLNGDKFPDIVGFEKVQYTTAQGGLSSSPRTHLIHHNGTHISAHKSVSVANSTSVSGSSPRAEKMTANNPKTAKTSVVQASSISASGGNSDDITDFTWLDINGDGLPDKVTKEGMVCLNYGYSFSAPQQWFTGDINKSESSNEGASVGFTFYNDSYSGGIGVDVSNSTISFSLTDINGDGLPDYVYKHNNSLRVKFNTGSEFDSNWYEISSEEINKSSSKSSPLNLSASAIIPIWGFKIIMNAGGSVSKSTSIDNLQIADFDGDGIPDIISSSSIDEVIYKKSKIGKTNLLKKVTNFAHGSFEVDYELSKPTFSSSQRQYVMSELVVFDGFVGDGSDYMRTQFEYDSAYYDRYERESFGFKKVVSKQIKEADNSVYRQTTELYHIDKLLFKGLKYYDVTTKSNTAKKLVANYYDYRLYDIATGVLIDDSNHCVNMVAYPGLNEKHTYYYKGDGSDYEKHHKISYTYGPYGNIKSYCNHGGVENGESEKFFARFEYHQDLQGKNILSSPQSIIVVNADSMLLQKRETEIDYNNGNIGKIKIYSTEHDYSDYLFDYLQNGNLNRIAYPIGADGNRYNLYYEYDPVLQQFPVKVRDILGFESSATYNYKFGAVTQTIDVGGNSMRYEYDDRGRLIELIGPYEMDNHDYYTIRHEYFNSRLGDIHINRATTRHFNPDFPEEDMLTVSFSDGLGRLVQTKKTSEIYNPQLGYAELMMTVSGKIIYDEFGRVVEAYYPTVCNIADTNVVDENFDNISPTKTEYDQLDRQVKITLPNNSVTTTEYGFGYDDFNKKQFEVKTTDFNGNVSYVFKNLIDAQTTIIDPLSNRTTFDYNPVGTLLSSTDPEGYKTSYNYDLANRLLHRNHPDAGITKYTYSPAGQVVTMATQDLYNKNKEIEYIYNYNQLAETKYPENPNMNIKYKYGEPTDGNNAGRLIFQEDATGLQQFEYGKLGELTKNIRTFALDPNNIYTFVTEWQYDTWNRLKEMIYPDGERVRYSYDRAGMLKDVNGVKGQDNFCYIKDNAYNKFGSKVMTICGNGIKTDYEYDMLNRLSHLNSVDADGNVLQDISYTFDPNNNITKVEKMAQIGVGGAMHSTAISYHYDQASRLIESNGYMTYDNDNYNFGLRMQYSPSGNITDKQLDANILEVSGATYKQYENHYQYNSNQPHTINTINNGEYNFLWSVNGNMTYSSDPNGERGLFWDEENRLTSVVDKGKTANYYTYDAAGERTLKLTGNFEQMNINGQYNIDLYNINRFALHTSPYIVFNNHGYTKHYYVEADRIASKIGGGMSHSGNDFGEHIYVFDISTQNDYGRKSEENTKTMYNHLDSAQSYLGKQYEVLVDVDYRRLQEFLAVDEPEKEIFFFHKDHLGSSTQISDRDQRVIHHIEYIPTGEQFLEQRDYWHTPYRFNGKELDEETGYYYYGARYYTPELGIWLSVDPLSDKYPSMSAFMYCAGNPVVLVDPDGRELELADDWVRTERGTYLYDSRVKSQKDAVKRYGDKSQSIGTGYSFNSDYGKVILGEKGVFSVDGEVGEYPDRAKGFSKGWASFKSIVSKIGEEGSHDGALTGKIDEQDLAVGLGVAGGLAATMAVVEGAAVLGVISLVSSINDIGTNAGGESLLIQNISNKNCKETAAKTENAANLLLGVTSVSAFVKNPTKAYELIGSSISMFKGYSNAKNNKKDAKNNK